MVATRVFRKSAYYKACLGRLGLAYALALPVRVDDELVIGLGINRAKWDFTVKDRAVLDAFGPHVALAWRRHGDPWKEREALPRTSRQLREERGLTARECDVLL